MVKKESTTGVECVEFMTSEMNESAKDFQKLVDALGEIECTKFFTKEEIRALPEHDKKMGDAFYKMVVEPLKEWLRCEDNEDNIDEYRE